MILIYNAIYSILPGEIQNMRFVKIAAIVISIIILIGGITQEIGKYRKFRFAYVSSKDGSILNKKNFPWRITKTKTGEGDIVFIINERYGDASEIIVKPDKPAKYTVYNAMDGVGIRFSSVEPEIPNFKVNIENP